MDPKKPKFITYRHFRTSHGSVTACCLVHPEEQHMHVGFSFCAPSEKNFSKKLGRQIAYGRVTMGRQIILELNGITNSLIDFFSNKAVRENARQHQNFLTTSFINIAIGFPRWFEKFAKVASIEYAARSRPYKLQVHKTNCGAMALAN